MEDTEAPSELHPLLGDDDFDVTPVYPIIHMIHQVWSYLQRLLHITETDLLAGHAGKDSECMYFMPRKFLTNHDLLAFHWYAI